MTALLVIKKPALSWENAGVGLISFLSQERFVQATIDRDDLAGSFAETFGY